MKNTDWLASGIRTALLAKDAKRPTLHLPSGVRSGSAVLRAAHRVDDLVALLRAANAPADVVDRAAAEVNANPDAGDIVQAWTLSTKRVDSYRDTIDPDGWDTDDFKRNPVVLFAHKSDELPVGKDLGTWVEKGVALRGTTRFASRDLSPFGHSVGQMVLGGMLNATSVGFEPVEYEESEDREGSWIFPAIDFKKQTLREYSVVPVPANADALADGRGVDLGPVRAWAERVLDGEGVAFLPRAMLERLALKGVVNIVPGVVAIAENNVVIEEQKAETPAPAVPEPMAEEKVIAEDTPCMCPLCGYAAAAMEFISPSTPEGSDVVPDAAVDSGSKANNDALAGLAAATARLAVREVQRQVMERTGRLP
jgi:phage head maturation protease